MSWIKNEKGEWIDDITKTKYNSFDFDVEGLNRITHGPRDPQGYDQNGWREDGTYKKTGTKRDEQGYYMDGFNKDGWNREKINKVTGAKLDSNGYDINGYDENGYNKEGFGKDGYDKNGFNKKGWNKKGINRDTGTKLDGNGYDINGYNEKGYDREGFDKKGWNKEGINKLTGYKVDRNGFDRDGNIQEDEVKKMNHVLLEKHKKFLRDLGLEEEGTRIGNKIRITHCWRCHCEIDNISLLECNKCGWIICDCGACGCGYHV